MKRSMLFWMREKIASLSSAPWACFETSGIVDNKVQFTIGWNKAFVNNLKVNGYEATTDEELVQLFFISTHMVPDEMMHEEDAINPEGTPRLSSEASILKR